MPLSVVVDAVKIRTVKGLELSPQ
eukprot:SAG31_NODE_30285_length_383_cov_0.728873_2_plen_23_part_01